MVDHKVEYFINGSFVSNKAIIRVHIRVGFNIKQAMTNLNFRSFISIYFNLMKTLLNLIE